MRAADPSVACGVLLFIIALKNCITLSVFMKQPHRWNHISRCSYFSLLLNVGDLEALINYFMDGGGETNLSLFFYSLVCLNLI